MSDERSGHLMQTTALVNEAYPRFIEWRKTYWESRKQLFGLSARLMRNILVDFARKSRRRGGMTRVFLDEASLMSSPRGPDLVALDEGFSRRSGVGSGHRGSEGVILSEKRLCNPDYPVFYGLTTFCGLPSRNASTLSTTPALRKS